MLTNYFETALRNIKRHKIYSFIIIADFVVGTTCFVPGTFSAIKKSTSVHELSIEKRIDNYIANLPDEFNGTILLAIGDTILLNKGYGWANRSFNIPNTSETMYELASVTKDFTTLLVFKLVELGLLELDATIDAYLPDYIEDKSRGITIRQLLLHQSGIRHHFQAISDFLGCQDRIYHTPRELLQLIWDKELAHEPGKGTTYSSPGYWLLAVIMETVSGKSFSELLHEYICKPLRMGNTYVDNDLTPYRNLATGYRKGLNGYVEDLREEQSNNIGAGDIISTTGDLFRFQRALSRDNDLILSKKTKQMLFEEQFRINDRLIRTMAATLALFPYNNGNDTLTLYGIGAGGNYGFQARMSRLLEADACYIVLSNVHNDRAMNELMFNYLQDILCEKLNIPVITYNNHLAEAESRTPVEISEHIISLYKGIYEAKDDVFFHFFEKDGNLHLRSCAPSFHGRKNVYGGELIPIDDKTFIDRSGFLVQYFQFLIPSQLPTDNKYASLRDLFADCPDANNYQLVRYSQWGMEAALRRDASRSLDIDLAEYQGMYYSVEMQRTFRFSSSEDELTATDFFGSEENFIPLRKDLFLCDKGFLIFHRYKDRSIRDFWLMCESIDHVYGALFIRK